MHPVSRHLIRRTPAALRRPVALTIRTADAAIRDRLPGLAAEIAFWVVLSLPALLLTLIAVASVVGGLETQDWQDEFVSRVVEVSRVALTEQTIDRTVRPLLEQLITEGDVTIVSFAFVATVWTASRAVKVVLVVLSIVHGREDHRPGWKDRLLGFGLTFAALLVGTVLAPLLLAGPAFGETLAAWLRTAIDVDLDLLAAVWRTAWWPTVVVGATLAIALLFKLGVPGRTRFLRALPGAGVATAVWLAGSFGLRLYGAWIAETGSVYGPLAGPIVALLWLWLTAFAVLLGAELNAQIDAVYPAHTDPDDPPPDAIEILTADRPDEAVDAGPVGTPQVRTPPAHGS